MKAHTPGPWHVDGTLQSPKHPNYYYVGGGSRAYVDEGGNRFTMSGHCGLANARLIAAAPELLEALRALMTNKHLDLGDLVYTVREREGEGWEGHSVKAWSDAVTAARAAIAKATGETP